MSQRTTTFFAFILIFALSLLLLLKQNISSVRAAPVNGPSAQSFNWNFRAVATNPGTTAGQQTAQVTFSWNQPDPDQQSRGDIGFVYQIQVANVSVFENQYKNRGKSYNDFCAEQGEQWQNVTNSDTFLGIPRNPVPSGLNQGTMIWIPGEPIRNTQGYPRGMYYRLVLVPKQGWGKVTFTDVGSRINPFDNRQVAEFQERTQPYILGCDDAPVSFSVNADPSQEKEYFQHDINAVIKKDKSDGSVGTPVEKAKVYIKRLSDNKILTPSEIGYLGERGADFLLTPTKTIPIRASVFGLNDDQTLKDYQLTVINPNKATDTYTGVVKNNDSKTMTVVFFEDGSPATLAEVTKNDPGITQGQAEDNARGETDCSKHLSFGNIEILKFATCQVRNTMLIIKDQINSLYKGLKI